MSKDQDAQILQLYGDLSKHTLAEDYDKALKLSQKILHIRSTEQKALQCKVVCLIHNSKFEEALGSITKAKMTDLLSFEKAYCEYRLGMIDEAINTIRSVKEKNNRHSELLAQLLYKQEEYVECLAEYRSLMKNTSDDFDEERQTNLAAVGAAVAMWNDEDPGELGLTETTYDMCYNTACRLLAQGEYDGAMAKLSQAEQMCREVYDDDPDDEEMDAELAVIRVQQGYCYQKLKKNNDALKLYTLVLRNRPDDVALAAVASNNVVTINQDQSVFDSRKKIKVAMADGLEKRLTSQQIKDIAMNHSLLLMYMNQGEPCRKSAAALSKKYPDSDTPHLVTAAQYSREKQTSKATETLKTALESLESPSITLRLTLAQLLLAQGNVYGACDVLKNLENWSYSLGVLSTIVALYLSQEDLDNAILTLNEAMTWYEARDSSSDAIVTLMRATSALHMRRGDAQAAAKVLERIHKHTPNDVITMAQLITAYSHFDASKAQALSRKLPTEGAADDVDVEALEAGVAALSAKYFRKRAPAAESADVSPIKGLIKPRKKKKRKPKLPKNPDAPLDPERWLPRRERSYYRGKRKDRRKDGVGKGTQGAASPSTEQDTTSPTTATSKADTTSPRGGATASSQTAGPRTSKPQGGKNKKKKKGGKW